MRILTKSVIFNLGFPLIHSSPAITLTVINGYSLLYKIEGSQPNATRPYMLAAHLDVVPVGDNWVHQPFGGDIVDNIIYGRGAFDDKNTVMVSRLKIVITNQSNQLFNFREYWKPLNFCWKITMNFKEHFLLVSDMMKRYPNPIRL